MAESRKGLMIVHTGPGKGKTTAALGTGLRAGAAGLRVRMPQFLKGSWHYGELDAVRAFGKVGAEKPEPDDVRRVEAARKEARREISAGTWDLVILDEINYAIAYPRLQSEPVAEFLRAKPERLHVILAGRNAHPALVELADTGTGMREIKHAFQRGILAQRGIEY